jgi:hypothetical protein
MENEKEKVAIAMNFNFFLLRTMEKAENSGFYCFRSPALERIDSHMAIKLLHNF